MHLNDILYIMYKCRRIYMATGRKVFVAHARDFGKMADFPNKNQSITSFYKE